jgi:hypothetical protein
MYINASKFSLPNLGRFKVDLMSPSKVAHTSAPSRELAFRKASVACVVIKALSTNELSGSFKKKLPTSPTFVFHNSQRERTRDCRILSAKEAATSSGS